MNRTAFDRPTLFRLLAAVAALGLFAWSTVEAWPYLADDALISLRYAQRLIEGHGLTWTGTERVEGYSNLLWVLLCGGLGAIGLDLVAASRWLGVGCAGASVVAVAWALRRQPLAGLLAGAGATALAAPLAIWGQSGMETGLVTALVAVATALLVPAVHEQDIRPARTWASGAVLAALCLTRPEAPLIVAALAAGWWLACGQGLRAVKAGLPLAGIPAAATLLLLTFRRLYYGEWLPNTAHAKLDVVTSLRVETGILYVKSFCESNPALCLLALLGLVLGARAFRQLPRLLLPLLLAYPAWVISVGGDHFPAWRFLVPMVPVLALLGGAGVAGIAARGRWPHLAVALALLPLGAWSWHTQATASNIVLAHHQGWVWEQRPVGELYRRALGEGQPLLATGAAGGIPFWSGLPCLDILGLTDATIARGRAVKGRMVGHQKGDPAYVLGREPDLVLFCGHKGGQRGCIPQEDELADADGFAGSYHLARIVDPASGASSQPWVRLDSARLGAQWSPDRVVLPAWMLSSPDGPAARPEDDGTLVLPLAPETPLTVELPLPAGVWRARSEPEGVEALLIIDQDGARAALTVPRPVTLNTVVFERTE